MMRAQRPGPGARASSSSGWQLQLQPAIEPAADSAAAAGEEIFLAGACTQCHNIAGVNPLDVATVEIYGPDLTHFADRNVFAGATLDNTPENLARWLANPPLIKPGSYMPNLNLTQSDIDALIAYLESLQ